MRVCQRDGTVRHPHDARLSQKKKPLQLPNPVCPSAGAIRENLSSRCHSCCPLSPSLATGSPAGLRLISDQNPGRGHGRPETWGQEARAESQPLLWGCASRVSPAEQVSWPRSTHGATGTWAPGACWKRPLADVDTVTLCCSWTTDHRGNACTWPGLCHVLGLLVL